MIISFGGQRIDLQDPDGAVDSFIAQHFEGLAGQIFGRMSLCWWSLQRAARSGRKAAVNLPVPNWAPLPPIVLNQMYWPTGACRWGFGLFLIDDNAAGSIKCNSNDTLTIQEDDPTNPDIDTHSGPTFQVNVLRPIPLTSVYMQTRSQDLKPTDKTLYVLPVVDQRFYWQFRNAGSLSLSCGTSWETLVNYLGSALGISINIETDIESEYLNPDPQELSRRFPNVALMLDAVAASIGRRVVVDPDTGDVNLYNSDDSDDIVQDENDDAFDEPDPYFSAGSTEEMLNSGSEDSSDSSQYFDGQLPSQVTVCFPKSWLDVAQADGDLYKIDIDTSDVIENIGTPSGTSKTIYSTCLADYSFSAGGSAPSTPNNDSNLNSLAQQIASDYLNYVAIAQDGTQGGSRGTLNGIRDWTLSGYDDHVRWIARRLPDGRYDARTIVAPMPSNFGVEEQLSQDQFAPTGKTAPSTSGVVGPLILGKANADISQGSSGVINVYNANTMTATGETINAASPLGAISSGAWVTVGQFGYTDGCGNPAIANLIMETACPSS